MDLVGKIIRNSLFFLVPVAAAAAFLDWKKLPLSILVGGGLGLLNMKALAWGVEGFVGTARTRAKMLFFSQFRLFVLFAVLAVLLYLRIVSVIGVLTGFTIVFVQTVIVGYRYARRS